MGAEGGDYGRLEFESELSEHKAFPNVWHEGAWRLRLKTYAVHRELLIILLLSILNWSLIVVGSEWDPLFHVPVFWQSHMKPYTGIETVRNGVPPVPALFASLVLFGVFWAIAMTESYTGLGLRQPHIAGNTLLFVLGSVSSIAIALFLSEALKHIIGQPRPDYLSRCYGLIADEELREKAKILGKSHGWPPEGLFKGCTNINISRSELTDGARSFPSGHATVSGAAFMFAILSIRRQYFNPGCGRLLKKLIIMALLSTLVGICVSRVLLNKHFISDVILGLILGFIVACISVARFWLFIPGEISDELVLMEKTRIAQEETEQPLVSRSSDPSEPVP